MSKITVEEAQARLDALNAKVDATEARMRRLEEQQYALSLRIRDAKHNLGLARAAADRNVYPVGTRVQHHVWPKLTATVVQSDGTGISVRQDATGSITHGFSAREWDVIE